MTITDKDFNHEMLGQDIDWAEGPYFSYPGLNVLAVDKHSNLVLTPVNNPELCGECRCIGFHEELCSIDFGF